MRACASMLLQEALQLQLYGQMGVDDHATKRSELR